MSKRVWSNLFCLARFVRLLDWIEGTTSTEVMSIPSLSRKDDVRNKTHQVSKIVFSGHGENLIVEHRIKLFR